MAHYGQSLSAPEKNEIGNEDVMHEGCILAGTFMHDNIKNVKTAGENIYAKKRVPHRSLTCVRTARAKPGH